ncbi:MAG TPA: DUF5996 family protein [Steroidobacteraceae bacterium]|nr:DUF5996 family protein [Steroidobacteraceae bacterium]
MTDSAHEPWPALPWREWEATGNTLHMWTQIVGKTRLELSPLQAHWWNVALYVTARGLSTAAMPVPGGELEIEFDFAEDQLLFRLSSGRHLSMPLRPQPVADFYEEYLGCLSQLGVSVHIHPVTVEVSDPIPFTEDRVHASYDGEYVRRFWRILMHTTALFQHFSSGFIGKISPVHFFWGSFDLAVTRFSGRRAPAFTGSVPGLATAVMREAYSHEVSSAGFWPGGNGIDYPAFYSYAYPVPSGFKDQPVRPAQANFSAALGEFLLPYDAVRTAADPDRTLLEFLQSTYEAAAATANWDRATLECASGECGVPRET